eukprot:TRINITY_DN10848_c0_g1_i1.p1 TRINITY_DN10848_c0_g1~~TRINITY_DN10848_c0_g1_i1.p1  ORF type:complete len:484 (+),score=182.45 TRINITY_DN10848_c0_g1_i1:57-1454(+)
MTSPEGLLEFVNNSPSPFHATNELSKNFEAAGFEKLSEEESWQGKLKQGGKYYFTRNQSTLYAFVVGGKFEPGNGFSIVAAHTDSPCLKLKPVSKKEAFGYLEVGVQTYGGGLWHTWFDRDLKLAGRVIVKKNEQYKHLLVDINKPVLRVPTLCIHLNREVREGFKFNTEHQLIPVIATKSKASNNNNNNDNNNNDDKKSFKSNHHIQILNLIAEELECEVDDIVDFEICLADYQPGQLGGIDNEFIFAARLDNLFNCYTTMKGLINCEHGIDDDESIRMAAFFDNEEVGSISANGANSNLMEHTLKRCTHGLATDNLPSDIVEVAIRKSFLISADQAHAVHPNYADKHESNHRPELHEGAVIKQNANQRYATNAITAVILKEIAAKYDIPVQEFVVKNDSACGSTIGPTLSSRGLRTVDIGGPQLSMHSIREMAGVDDVKHVYDLIYAFYKDYTVVNKNFSIDN